MKFWGSIRHDVKLGTRESWKICRLGLEFCEDLDRTPSTTRFRAHVALEIKPMPSELHARITLDSD